MYCAQAHVRGNESFCALIELCSVTVYIYLYRPIPASTGDLHFRKLRFEVGKFPRMSDANCIGSVQCAVLPLRKRNRY